MGALTLDDIDARIASLGAEIDTTGSSLAALDGDITLKLLASAKLSGRTAAEWNTVSPDIPLLWGYYGALKDKVAEIVALRGTRSRLRIEQLEELSAQLLGDSVTVPADPGQPGSRNLTGTPLRKASIAWLQSTMATMYRDIASVVDRVCAAWTALPRLDTLDATLTGLIQTASGSGVKPPAEIVLARSRRPRLVLMDIQLPGMDGVAALRQLRADPRTAGIPVVALTARALPSDRAECLSITSVGHGDWQEARRLLGQLDQQTAALREEVTLALEAVKGPLDTRNELRGRLDAYHAKALAIGLAEDERLTQVYERARALLFTAPCDVAGAEAAVREYQQGLSRPRVAGGPDPA